MFEIKGVGIDNVLSFARSALGEEPERMEVEASKWYPGEKYLALMREVGERLGGKPEVYREMGAFAAKRASHGVYRLLFSYISSPTEAQSKKEIIVRLYYRGVSADAEILAPGRSRIYLDFHTDMPEFYVWFLEGWIGEIMRGAGAKRVEVRGRRQDGGKLAFEVSWET